MNDAQANLMTLVRALQKVSEVTKNWSPSKQPYSLPSVAVPSSIKVPLNSIAALTATVLSTSSGAIDKRHVRYVKSKTGVEIRLRTSEAGALLGGIIVIGSGIFEFGD